MDPDPDFDPDPDADPNPAIFVMTFKTSLLFEGTFESSFNDKKSNISHSVGINVFLLFLLKNGRIWIRIRISNKWIRIREAQKHMYPTDPDPKH
jgi:hypothetical protein